MKTVLSFCVAAGISLQLFAADTHAEPKFGGKPHAAKPYDGQSLQGIWKPVTAVLGGQPMPPLVLKAITLRITNDLYEVSVQGEPEPDQGKWTLDSTSQPKGMTITSTNGPTVVGVFQRFTNLKVTNFAFAMISPAQIVRANSRV